MNPCITTFPGADTGPAGQEHFERISPEPGPWALGLGVLIFRSRVHFSFVKRWNFHMCCPCVNPGEGLELCVPLRIGKSSDTAVFRMYGGEHMTSQDQQLERPPHMQSQDLKGACRKACQGKLSGRVSWFLRRVRTVPDRMRFGLGCVLRFSEDMLKPNVICSKDHDFHVTLWTVHY